MPSYTFYLTTFAALLGAVSSLPTTTTPFDFGSGHSKVSTKYNDPKDSPYTSGFLDFFDQPTCSGAEQGVPITLNTTACHKLKPASEHMFIGWTAEFKSVTFYSDDHCGDKITEVKRPQSLALSYGSCAHMKDFGKEVKSVKDTS
ncbi:MAG: hypothetical protein Q9170_006565 [Blastenia crenularia]